MSYKDLYTYTQPFQTVPPAAYNSDVTGAGVDRKFNESAIIVLNNGTWTDGTHTFTLEESDDNVMFTTVAAADIQGATPVIADATTDDTAFSFGYIGSKRYLRVFVDVVGATTGAVYGVTIVQDYPRYAGSSQLEPYNKNFD